MKNLQVNNMLNNSLIITSDNLRHLYFAQEMHKVINPYNILIQHKNEDIYNIEEIDIIPYTSLTNIQYSVIEKEDYQSYIPDYIQQNDINYVFIFGCSLLPKHIVNLPEVNIINLHTGLTQYYRGVDSSMWALYNNQPHNIGITIHKVDNGIDTGDVYYQQLFDLQLIDKNETIESLFVKVCKFGIDIFVNKALDIFNSVPYKVPKGTLYTTSMYAENIRNTAQDNLNKFKNR